MLFQRLLAPFRALAAKKGGLPLIILLVVIVIGFYLLSTRKVLVPIAPEERVWAVDAVTASYADVQPELTLYGQVISARSSELRGRVSGRIVEVAPNFRDGGIVEKDEVLLSIDRFDYETELAQQRSILTEAEIAMAKSRRKYARATELHAEKNVSDEFLDDAELNLRQEEARVEQQGIAVLRAERDLQETAIVAPFSGVISEQSVELGQQIGSNDKLADVVDLSRLEVRFSLSNTQFGRLIGPEESLVGRPVKVTWEVGSEPLNFNGLISRAGAQISSSMGGVTVYANLDATDRFTRIRPGALVLVRVADMVYKNVIQAPDSVLYSDNTVYLVRDNRLLSEVVDVLGFSEGAVYFRPQNAGAIINGDLIVTTQLREAGIGARVEVR
ncbi:MAG: efflux RND transporter periplasmic adaptor subunit [Gammaproteobacteria bacterium]|jgi:RND family efflux transporter MFP subunit|nr:efflux RND transporter periplasmic adaptor subunit [Gammaproteobacteria bacterium]